MQKVCQSSKNQMKRFSERIGITKPPMIQDYGINTELRNSLWNVMLTWLENEQFRRSGGVERLRNRLVVEFFKLPLDEMCNYTAEVWIKKQFYSLKWHGVYDFVEFLVQNEECSKLLRQEELNKILERENSGYRLINGRFVQVINEQEIKAIEEATEKATQFGIEGAKKHLDTALSLLAKKPEPDYRNSIKESISAVESLAVILSGKNKCDFVPALEELSEKIPLHGALKEGFKKLYGYTSDEDGIRHAMLEDANVGYDEAKFMLVSCSAFVNFLFSKAQKAGLLKEG